MQLIDIVNNLFLTEEKELVLKAYKHWCLSLFNKYELNNYLLEEFIMDITQSKEIVINEYGCIIYNYILDGDSYSTFYLINFKYRTSSQFDVILKKVLEI